MRVIDEIRIARGIFYRDTGKEPSSVYLGRENWARFRHEVSDYAVYTMPSGNRPQAYGMVVYVVDSDDHLAVS